MISGQEFDEIARLRAENERLRADLDEEEKTVYAAMGMLKKVAAENERLLTALRKATLALEDGQAHNEGAFDASCDTCVLLKELRAIEQTEDHDKWCRSLMGGECDCANGQSEHTVKCAGCHDGKLFPKRPRKITSGDNPPKYVCDDCGDGPRS